MESNHHGACRCNGCVRRRNSRRQFFVERRSGGGNPQPSSATLYEVQGDHSVTYEGDVHQSAGERPRPDDVETDAEERPEQTRSQALNVGPARRQQEQARPGAGAEVSGDVGERPPDETDGSYDTGRDDAAGPPGSTLERAEREISQPSKDVDRDPAPQREEVAFQREATARLNSEALTHGRESTSPPEHGDIHTSAEYPESEDAALTPDRVARRQDRRRFALPLILALVIVMASVVAGVLAAVLLSSPPETSTAEIVEPTPDVEATIAATVRAAIAAQNTDQVNPTNGVEENAPPTIQPQSENAPPTIQPQSENAPPTIQPQSENAPPIPPFPQILSGYVNWERPPEISETGELVFTARIEEAAAFVVAGDDCGFANVSLTDNTNTSYGSVMPRSMAVPCGTGSGGWVSNQYYYAGNLLTVTVQLSSEIAAHAGLTLCLWAGGATDEENRLLDCVPVRRP